MKNPYKKNNQLDELCSKIIESVMIKLNDEISLKPLNLSNEPFILKQAIPRIINDEKETFVELFKDCISFTEEYYKSENKDVLFLATNSVLKFIKEIDKICVCIEK